MTLGRVMVGSMVEATAQEKEDIAEVFSGLKETEVNSGKIYFSLMMMSMHHAIVYCLPLD